MIKIGLIIGFYAFALSVLGFASLLQEPYVGILSILFFLALIISIRSSFSENFKLTTDLFRDKYTKALFALTVLASVVNLMGALSPETSFDALWYHLTIPKLYVQEGRIFFIDGGLLYYSGLPKLVEILYVPAIMFSDEIAAKLVHFTLGICCLVSLFVLSRKYVASKYAMLAVAIFAGNLVFVWESTTAFNDLGWVFYEILAFISFTEYLRTKKTTWMVILGFMLGFAVLTKLVAAVSVFIYLCLLFIAWSKQRKIPITRLSFIIIVCSLLPALPWFIFNYLNTGNPIYPFLTDYLKVGGYLTLDPASLMRNVLFPPDPLSPLYLIFLPFAAVFLRKFSFKYKLVFGYIVLTFLSWFLISGTGGARFFLPYLPVYSVGVVMVIKKLTETWGSWFHRFSLYLIMVILVVCIGYRFLAQMKFLPYLGGTQSKSDFLSENLNYAFGDFYDTDGYFLRNIKNYDLVLIYGTHNLYYVNFPYLHESWYKNEEITHVLTQNTSLPAKFSEWKKVYSNERTNVILYKNPN